ncbi:MAG: TetR/AcrR family transcriptional regulator [bacterium]|nr:TetR/AcrR family transcriptional regulator [bacterium]MCM1375465.1 TetR/AcrR family transcriptional regulator [Muribaculum sp.]
MARNKYPEETVNLIIETATRLFVQKGYERTSIQDIINNLGGLSKGAIYHHFKSKEDILIAVMNKMSEQYNKTLFEIRNRTDMTGKEKLKKLLKDSVNLPVQDSAFSAAPNIKSSPALVYSILMDSVETVAPQCVLPIIKQGINDGSIQTEYPEELAELIVLVGNVWLDSMIFDDDPEKIYRKCVMYDKMLRGFGLDIFDGSMFERLRSLTEMYCKNK